MNNKKRRNIISLLALFVMLAAIWFQWRRGVAYTQEEMLELIRKKERLDNNSVITLLEDFESPWGRLLCLEAKGENDAPRYYAVEFRPDGEAWAYWHSYKLLERGPDMYSLNWAGSYLFISGNPRNTDLWLDLPGEGERKIPVTQHPFCYRLEDAPDSFEYLFLDGEGKALSP